MSGSRLNRHHFRFCLVSLLCFFGAGVGGYFLYLDLNQLGGVGLGKSLGTVVRREASVRRKSGTSYIWTLVQPAEVLYRKDSIQTGKGSAASIRLSDGSLLDLGEESLVVMDDTAELSLSFMRGSAVVHKPDGESKLVVSKGGQTKIEELSATLIQPESLARYFVVGKEPKKVLFSWKLRQKPTHGWLTLQVSQDQKFLPQWTQSFEIQDLNQKSFVQSLGPGRYYWRLQSNGKTLTEIRQFKLLSAFALKPIWPDSHQKIQLARNQTSIQLRWVSASDIVLGEHRIEWARDPSMRDQLQSQSINPGHGSTQLSDLSEGKYYWRIRSVYEDLDLVSEIRSFQISFSAQTTSSSYSETPASISPTATPAAPVLLAAPTTLSPESGAVLTLLRPKVPIELSWSSIEGAATYEVMVYQEQTQTSPRKLKLHLKTAKTTLPVKDFGPGTYLWAVRAIDRENLPGAMPSFRRLVLTYGDLLKSPKVLSPEAQ